MNCKNCGLEIEDSKMFSPVYNTRYWHKAHSGVGVFYSCLYANRIWETGTSGTPQPRFDSPMVAATPDDKEGGAGTAFILAPEPVNRIVINVLPEVKGRRFR